MYSYYHPALITIIKNTTAKTFHPIVFLASPLPGGTDGQPKDCNRYRSKMHHTGGFKTLQETENMIFQEKENEISLRE